jgi:phosphotransferase system enzyme I (PtsI)
MITLKGLGGGAGCASGIAVIKRQSGFAVPMRSVTDLNVERGRFLAARQSCDSKLIELAEQTAMNLGEKSAEIFEAYRVILHDDFFFGKIFDRVNRELLNIEYVIKEECEAIHRTFEGISNAYMRERAVDIENVCYELIYTMMGLPGECLDEVNNYEDVIIVGHDLTPMEIVKLDRTRLRGLVTERGGITSHTVILAEAMGVPAIVGVEDALAKIETGTPLLLDSDKSEVIIDHDGQYKDEFFAMRRQAGELQKIYNSEVHGVCETRDRFRLDVCVNLGDKEDISNFSPANCDGIGILRTEFLYVESPSYPTEQYQYELYKDMAVYARGKEVVVRTPALGGAVQAPYMHLHNGEENPALGYRAIRISLERRDVFLTQLRAVLRAAVHGNIKLLLPMIVTLEELIDVKNLIAEAAASLSEEGLDHRKDLPVGVMIETPAAVILSDRLAVECDFFCIGDDLIQYVTVADRANPNVQSLCESCNISVLRSIQMVAKNAEAAGIPWGICGDAASEDILVPLWVAMGVSDISVAFEQIGRIKYIVRRCERAALLPEMETILSYGTIGEAKAHLCGILTKIDK